MQYEIVEENMPRMEKKLVRIQKKCAKYGNDFQYRILGETYKDFKFSDGTTATKKCVVVDVDGLAKVNGWTFAGTIEHTKVGNILRAVNGVQLPERFRTVKCTCEHCKTSRYRKNTYVIRNESGVYMQVGKNCLQDYTNGLSAQAVAAYAEICSEMIAASEPGEACQESETYYNKFELLKYAFETVDKYGFLGVQNPDSTRDRTYRYYCCGTGKIRDAGYREVVRFEMRDFNVDSRENDVESALAWITSQNSASDYIHNLKTVCALEYVGWRDIALLVSLVPAYNKQTESNNVKNAGDFVGEVGDRVTFSPTSKQIVFRTVGCYGDTFIYKFTDSTGNVFTWSTGKNIDFDRLVEVTGTIKDHKEYKGEKQNVLTRCKCKFLEKQIDTESNIDVVGNFLADLE